MLRSVTAATAAGGAMRRDASLILRTCIVNRQRVGCRHAGSHVEQGLDLWIDGHVRYPMFGITVVVAMGKCVIGPVNDGNRWNASRISCRTGEFSAAVSAA